MSDPVQLDPVFGPAADNSEPGRVPGNVSAPVSAVLNWWRKRPAWQMALVIAAVMLAALAVVNRDSENESEAGAANNLVVRR